MQPGKGCIVPNKLHSPKTVLWRNELDAGIIFLSSLEPWFLCWWCWDYGWDGQYIVKILPCYIGRLCVTTGLPSVQLWKGVLLPQVAAVNNILGVLQQLWSPVHRPDPVSLDPVQTGKKKPPQDGSYLQFFLVLWNHIATSPDYGKDKNPKGKWFLSEQGNSFKYNYNWMPEFRIRSPAWQGCVPVFIKYISVIYAVFLLIVLSA